MAHEWFALSIQQPWMDLIVRGQKTIEVRTWEVKRRGPILLHASRTVDWKATFLFCYEDPLALARGALVGYAEILDVFRFTRERWLATAESHWVVAPLGESYWGAVLGNVQSFARPIRCPGKRFFFPVSGRVAERVETQLERIGISL
jgi:hypothetical protein